MSDGISSFQELNYWTEKTGQTVASNKNSVSRYKTNFIYPKIFHFDIIIIFEFQNSISWKYR